MNDKKQLAAMGEHLAEQQQPMCLQKRVEQLEALLREARPYLKGCADWGSQHSADLIGAISDALEGATTAKQAAPEGWQLVPFNPTEEQWGGLARAIVFFMRSYQSNQHTPRTLLEFITSYGHTVPKWMTEESELLAKDHVISKGTISALIYKAMLAAAPSPDGTK